MLLAAVGIGAVGVVQTSIEPRAEAEPMSLGAISAQMRDHSGDSGSDEANCIRYQPADTSTSSEFVTSTGEALAAHGWLESCPEDLDLDQQSAVGITPAASGDFTNGESFLLAEVSHYNRRVEGNGDENYSGVARLRFGDFDGDPTIDIAWDLWETPNSSGMGQRNCPIRGPRGGELPCVDQLVFTIPGPVMMTKGGLSYRLTIDEVAAVEGEESCPTTSAIEVMVDDHEDEHEEEGNSLLTAETLTRQACVYGTVILGRQVVVTKAIEGADEGVVAPSTTFTIESESDDEGSPWNTTFELTPPDDGADSSGPLVLVSNEKVTLTEADPMNPRWELTDVMCVGTDDWDYDSESGELMIGSNEMTMTTAQVDDGPITCTFTNTYTPMTTLTLVKEVTDGEASVDDFVLNATGVEGTPTEGEGVSGVSGSDDVTQAMVPAGDYVLSEDGPEGYLSPDGWDCGEAELDGSTVTLEDDDDVTCTIVNEVEREEISLSKDPSTDWFSAGGQTITYTYVITNTGNQPLGPGQFEVTDDKIDGGVAFDCGADEVSLDPSDTVSCTRDYVTTVDDVTTGEVMNMAFASYGELNSATVSATVDYADLLIAKSASPTSVTAAGQTVTYTYTLTNNADEALGPDQFTVTDDKINSGTAFNCGAAATTIAVDGTLSCTSTYTVTSADVTAGSIVNLASAQGAGVTSPTVSATVTVTSPPPVVPPVVPPVFVPGGGTPVLPVATPSLNLTKTASPDTFFAAGEVITYTYTILNDGKSAIGPTQFTITDNKINGGQPFNCGPATKVISVNLNQMCTAYYTITAADVAAGSVTNVAFASGGTVDSNTATATVSLVSLIFPAEIPVTGSMSTTVIAFGLVTLGLGLGLITLMRRRRIL